MRKDTALAEELAQEGGLAKRRDWVAIGTTHDKAQAVTVVCDAWADDHDEVRACAFTPVPRLVYSSDFVNQTRISRIGSVLYYVAHT